MNPTTASPICPCPRSTSSSSKRACREGWLRRQRGLRRCRRFRSRCSVTELCRGRRRAWARRRRVRSPTAKERRFVERVGMTTYSPLLCLF
ncbi:dual specificity protein kinase shkE-like [Iris pallida]|uniref:Dual specificity protein kinase shkE-like n=1 Tax=Iris pallida TaxID=29817 RepID=A0AAX6IJ81_IRIPA|nr:dual specificity protein kinase shkE-like [Iris pallida]KAJ6852884.1 dual specificity protein kinase shkE-like [Iris pallida]